MGSDKAIEVDSKEGHHSQISASSENPPGKYKKNGRTLIVTGQIGEISLNLLVDTGTTDTIISEHVYNGIPAHSRPKLLPVEETGKQADGSPLHTIGWAPMNVSIGSIRVLIPVTVARVTDDALLGMDFMELTGCTIDPKNKQLIFGSEVVQCFTEESRAVCTKVTIE